MTYKFIFLVFIALDLAYDLILRILSASRRGKPLPDTVRDIYDADSYARWLDYSAEKRKLGALEKIFDAAVLSLLFGTNVFSAVYDRLPGNDLGKSLLLLLLFTALLTVLSVPFDWAREKRIEAKYGFGKTETGTFLRDEITGFLTNTLLNAALYLAVAWCWRTFGLKGFFGVFLILAVFVAAFSMLSTTFQRLYNKFTPLEDGTLRRTLADLFKQAGYELENIYVMDASKRTSKANAFCSGLGRFKKIVLYDNLVNGYTEDEIAAVFAHELGHYRHRDTMKNTVFTVLLMGIVAAAAAWFAATPEVSLAYGFDAMSPVFGVILLQSVALTPVLTLFMIPRAIIARRFEFRADAAAAESGYGEALISALKKLSRDNFSDLNPHPAVVALEYDHPTTADRIRAVREREGQARRPGESAG